MQLSVERFLTLISTTTLFLGTTLAMPLDGAIGSGQAHVQCGGLWTSIGLCRVGDTEYTLNSNYCSNKCYCDGATIVCPDQYGACGGLDVADHCTRYNCRCL